MSIAVCAPLVRIGLGMVRMWKCCDGSVVVQVCIWTFQVSGNAKYVMQRGVGLPGSDATSVMLHVTRFPTTLPWGPLGRAPPQSRSSGPPTRSSGPGHVPPRNMENFRGLVLAPVLPEQRLEKKGEASELLQALSLLQSIMSPVGFAKYRVLVAPQPKRGENQGIRSWEIG